MQLHLYLHPFLEEMHSLHILFCGHPCCSGRKCVLQKPREALLSAQLFSSWLMRGELGPTNVCGMMASHKLSSCPSWEKWVCLPEWAAQCPHNCQRPYCQLSFRGRLSLALSLHFLPTPPMGEFICGDLNVPLPFTDLLLFYLGRSDGPPMLKPSSVFFIWTCMTFLLHTGAPFWESPSWKG